MSGCTNVFAGSSLDRNAERRDDPDWADLQRRDRRARYLLLGDDASALIRNASDALLLLDAEAFREVATGAGATYLGSDESGPLFHFQPGTAIAQGVAADRDGRFIDLRSAGTRLSSFEAGLFAYARAIAHWQSRTRFCGVCGATVDLVALGHRGRCTNLACATEHFPRVDPAMIVIVTWGEQCLLGHQATWSENRYSTLAGFVEPGESLEDAVRREVLEESGVRVGACHYHSSQPWPFPSSLMLGFTAQASDPAIRIGAELSDARWFSVDDLVAGLADRSLVLPPSVSVSHMLIAHWMRQISGLELASLTSAEPWLKSG